MFLEKQSDDYWAEVWSRASHPLSATPRPFLRWAGSKRALTRQIVEFLPLKFNSYHEPFLGSGALFLLLQPNQAFLNDYCADLVDMWRAVKYSARLVADVAESFPLDKDTYYKVRKNRSSGLTSRAGEMLYLNRGCFNGLYRVNSSGNFNVPWGAPRSSYIVDRANLLEVQKLLRRSNTQITNLDFEEALENCRSGDLVFLDPPYVTKHNNNGFAEYNQDIFSWVDQQRLAATAESLRKKGCKVLITNAYHKDIVKLYPKFELKTLTRHSTLAGDTLRRGKVKEALFIGRSRTYG